MWHHYSDITDKLGEPLWWDEGGVPRYVPFSHDVQANVYARQVALCLIRCQACGYLFKVAFSHGVMNLVNNIPSLSERIDCETLDYGDPPNNGCCDVGATMNSVFMEVLEFWERCDLDDKFEWKRNKNYERKIN